MGGAFSALAADTHDYTTYAKLKASTTVSYETPAFYPAATAWNPATDMSDSSASITNFYIPSGRTLTSATSPSYESVTWYGNELAVAGTFAVSAMGGRTGAVTVPPLAVLPGGVLQIQSAYGTIISPSVDVRGTAASPAAVNYTYSTTVDKSGYYAKLQTAFTGARDAVVRFRINEDSGFYNYQRAFRVTGGFAGYLGTVILDGATTWMRDTSSTTFDLGGTMVITNGATLFLDTRNPTFGGLVIAPNSTLRIDSGKVLTVNGPLEIAEGAIIDIRALALSAAKRTSDVQENAKIAFLSVSDSASAAAVDRAKLHAALKITPLKSTELTLAEETRTDGGVDFFVRFDPIVVQLKNGGSGSGPYGNAYTPSEWWSDGQATSGTKMYSTDSMKAYVNKTFTFAGKVWIVNKLLGVYNNKTTITVADLRLTAGSYIRPQSQERTGETFTGGTIDISGGATIGVFGASTMTLASRLTGSGDLYAIYDTKNAYDRKAPKGYGTVILTGDNSAFAGHIYVGISSGVPEQTSVSGNNAGMTNVTLQVSSGTCLGGALPTFTYDALKVGPSCTIAVTGDATFDAANRGWCLLGNTVTNAAVNVAANKVATVNETVTFRGLCEKQGAGRLVLGGEAKLYDTTVTKLHVKEGALQITHKDALKGLSEVKFAEGTSVVVDLAATGDVGTKGIVNPTFAATTVPVTLTASAELENEGAAAICTVASSLKDTLTFTLPDRAYRRKISLVCTDNGDDTVTFKVKYERAGFAVFLK